MSFKHHRGWMNVLIPTSVFILRTYSSIKFIGRFCWLKAINCSDSEKYITCSTNLLSLTDEFIWSTENSDLVLSLILHNYLLLVMVINMINYLWASQPPVLVPKLQCWQIQDWPSCVLFFWVRYGFSLISEVSGNCHCFLLGQWHLQIFTY